MYFGCNVLSLSPFFLFLFLGKREIRFELKDHNDVMKVETGTKGLIIKGEPEKEKGGGRGTIDRKFVGM